MKANNMQIKSYAKTPFCKQIIFWIVDKYSGQTVCEAWKVQYEIDCLERAGYKIIGVENANKQ